MQHEPSQPGATVRAGAPRAAGSISMKRLQRADKALGRLACVLLQLPRCLRRERAPAAPARRVLLIKFWGIGSLQLLTPAARALRRRHPGARLTLLTLAQNADFARGLGAFDEVLALDVRCRRWIQVFRRIARLLRELRQERFERVYDFEFFTRFSAVVSFLTGAPGTVGFAAPSVWRGRLHCEEVPFNRYWHVARNFRALAGGENGREVTHAELLPFRAGPAEEAGARAALAAAGLDPWRALVVLNPNAGQLSLERRWPAANFSALARRLIEEEGCAVALVGAATEREHVAAVCAAVGPVPCGALADLSGKLAIGELAALLSAAAAVVSNDSGPMHVAAASSTPTLGLFGPETPTMYAPIGPGARALWDPPVCSPCINVHDNKVANCIHGRPECLVNLTVERVLGEARALLREGRNAAPPELLARRRSRPLPLSSGS